MNHLDGNAVAAELGDLFRVTEPTLMVLACRSCHRRHRLAEARVYLNCPGIVLRCPACAAAHLVIVDLPTGPRLTMFDVRAIDLPAADSQDVDESWPLGGNVTPMTAGTDLI